MLGWAFVTACDPIRQPEAIYGINSLLTVGSPRLAVIERARSPD